MFFSRNDYHIYITSTSICACIVRHVQLLLLEIDSTFHSTWLPFVFVVNISVKVCFIYLLSCHLYCNIDDTIQNVNVCAKKLYVTNCTGPVNCFVK